MSQDIHVLNVMLSERIQVHFCLCHDFEVEGSVSVGKVYLDQSRLVGRAEKEMGHHRH